MEQRNFCGGEYQLSLRFYGDERSLVDSLSDVIAEGGIEGFRGFGINYNVWLKFV